MRRRTLTLLVAGLMVIAACGADTEEGTSETTGADTGDTTTTAVVEEETTTTTAGGEETTTTAVEEVVEGVHAAETDLGTILVDTEGFTLYVFTNDTAGESTCNEGCIDTWPAVPGDTAIGSDLDATLFGTTTRTDGSEQLTVNGQPLYRYTPDAAPGDANGQGVGGVWFVVGTDGNLIGGPEAATQTTSLTGYDY
ncbi:MAG: COG4315 family predicted lipoprotein [Acidimicrobiia bacterium]